MENDKPTLICEKCHTRRLSPIYDKGHRWCKKCRSAEFARLSGAAPDQRRKLRAGYEYTGVAALLKAVVEGEPGMVRYATATKIRFDYTSTHKRQRARLMAQGRLLQYKPNCQP